MSALTGDVISFLVLAVGQDSSLGLDVGTKGHPIDTGAMGCALSTTLVTIS
jgi:hypothetical protein